MARRRDRKRDHDPEAAIRRPKPEEVRAKRAEGWRKKFKQDFPAILPVDPVDPVERARWALAYVEQDGGLERDLRDPVQEAAASVLEVFAPLPGLGLWNFKNQGPPPHRSKARGAHALAMLDDLLTVARLNRSGASRAALHAYLRHEPQRLTDVHKERAEAFDAYIAKGLRPNKAYQVVANDYGIARTTAIKSVQKHKRRT